MDAAVRLLTDPAALARELAGSSPPLVIDVRWRLGGPPGQTPASRSAARDRAAR